MAEEGLLSSATDRINGEGGPFAGLRPVYDYLDGVLHTNTKGVGSRRKRSGLLPPFGFGSGQLPRMIPVAPAALEAQAHLRSDSRFRFSRRGACPHADDETGPHGQAALDLAPRRSRPVRSRVRSVLEHQGEAPRPADERSVSIAGQGPHRTAREHHGRRLRDQSEPADPGGLDA